MRIATDLLDKVVNPDSHYLCLHAHNLTASRVEGDLLQRFEHANRSHLSSQAQVNLFHRFCRVLSHVLRVMARRLPRLLEDFLCLSVNKVRPIVELLKELAHLAIFDDVDVLGFVTLLEKFASTSSYLVLELLVQGL